MSARRLIGLLLMALGVAVPVIYFTRAAAPASAPTVSPVSTPVALVTSAATAVEASPTATSTRVPSTPTPTRIVERLIPTVAATRVSATKLSATKSSATKSSATKPAATTSPATQTPTKVTATRVPPTSTVTGGAAPTQSVGETPTAMAGPPYTWRQRFGIGVSLSQPWFNRLGETGAGWFLDWHTRPAARLVPGMEFVQLVSVPRGQLSISAEQLAELAREVPGALWFIGNEPDVIWQNNATPQQYAAAYHAAYTAIKTADPTSRVAIGGVSQPTPLRLQYLDLILAAYRQQFGVEMPVDVWNVHAFILQELRGDWGVDIPPGLSAGSGQLYTIEQHDDLAIFKQQIVAFRQWMAQRGYRDKELIVSEYGALMPPDFGFPPERVRDFMVATFDYFTTATDAALGMPQDGNRLVQRWCWYSLSDNTYPSGNLYDRATGEITLIGQAFSDYIRGR